MISTKHAASEKKWSLTRNLDLKNNQKKLTPKSTKFSSDSAFVSSMGQLIDSDEHVMSHKINKIRRLKGTYTKNSLLEDTLVVFVILLFEPTS